MRVCLMLPCLLLAFVALTNGQYYMGPQCMDPTCAQCDNVKIAALTPACPVGCIVYYDYPTYKGYGTDYMNPGCAVAACSTVAMCTPCAAICKLTTTTSYVRIYRYRTSYYLG